MPLIVNGEQRDWLPTKPTPENYNPDIPETWEIADCVWCRNPNSDYEPANPEKELCNSHLAEYEGLSEDELNRMYSEQEMDLL
jgi:hypothetical protein